ncbi:right-handed parallel beta-helix repeat-containing protein [Pedobacter sp. P351]|uniref:right-handed parallel beta-helix repeat-containing protein n=1 Tax=Pedobacter superstes TaxID=3133441 RepID=UPI00309EC0DE
MTKSNFFLASLLKVTAFAAVIVIASCNKTDSSLSDNALVTSGTGKSSAKVSAAYTNEVRASGNSYVWRINGVDQGSTSKLADAINNCIGTGNRDVHVITGGNLSAQINLQPGLNLYFHNNILAKKHNGYGFFRDGGGPIGIFDMTLTASQGMGIRTSRASNVTIQNVKIIGGSIGIRIDSHPSRPYEDGRWVKNIDVSNCTFENGSSHGLETYGVDGFTSTTIIAKNMGECGVLLNKTINGTMGTVDAFRCNYGGGYAGLRLANTCERVTINQLFARECGRGYFVLSGSNNCKLNNAQVFDTSDAGIWLENVVACTVEAGCTNEGVYVTGDRSYANVTQNCTP